MQQFVFLLLATYTAQVVFVKTFTDQSISEAIRKSSSAESQSKFSRWRLERPPSGSLALPALNHTWNSGLCQTLISSPAL